MFDLKLFLRTHPLSQKFFFNGFKKEFFSIPEKENINSTYSCVTVFPKVGENIKTFLGGEEGIRLKNEIIDCLKKLKECLHEKRDFSSVKEELFFKNFSTNKKIVDSNNLNYLKFFGNIVMLAQEEMLPFDARLEAIKNIFEGNLNEVEIKKAYFKLMQRAVEKYSEELKEWARKNNVACEGRVIKKFKACFHEELCEKNQELLIEGVALLAKICFLIRKNKILNSKKWVIAALLESLDVCEPGVYTHLTDAYLQLSEELASKFERFRRELAEDIANRILIENHKNRNASMDVHVVNRIISLNQTELGIFNITDVYAAQSEPCVVFASEMQEGFMERFKSILTPRYLIEKILEEDINPCLKNLSEASVDSWDEVYRGLIFLLNFYGEDKNFLKNRFLYDQAILKESQYKKHVLAADARDILIESLIRRLIASDYLEKNEVQSFEHGEGVFYCFPSFPESSFFVSNSNVESNLLNFVSTLIKEGSVIPRPVLEALLAAFSTCLSRQQDASIISYFSLWRQLIEIQLLKKEDLLRILTQEGRYRSNLGVIIAYYQDGKTMTAYFSWLSQLIETKNIEREDLLKILIQQNKNEWTLGFVIARYQEAKSTAVTSYLSWLNTLIETHLLEKEDLLKILTQQNQNKWTLGMMIAWHHDAATITAYISLLTKLTEKPGVLEKKNLIKMLTQQNQDGLTLNMIIACYHDVETTASYLSWLSELIEVYAFEAEDLLEILNHQEKNGWTLGLVIVYQQDTTLVQQYLTLLETCIEKEKLDPEQLAQILIQKNNEGQSVASIISRCQDKRINQQYEVLQQTSFLMNSMKKILLLLEVCKFEEAFKQLEDLLSRKAPGLTDSKKRFLNEKMRSLISVFNNESLDQKTEGIFLESLKNISSASLFYTSVLISQLKFRRLDPTTLDVISLKLDSLSRTHFDYFEGQLALASYYINLYPPTKKVINPNELLKFLVYAERCSHAMLDRGYDMLRNCFIEERNASTQAATSSFFTETVSNDSLPQDNKAGLGIILKKILKKLVPLVSDNPIALGKLKEILNQRNEDALLDFYLERILFHISSVSGNFSTLLNLATFSLFSVNKSKRIQITSERRQELEDLISQNRQDDNVKELIRSE